MMSFLLLVGKLEVPPMKITANSVYKILEIIDFIQGRSIILSYQLF